MKIVLLAGANNIHSTRWANGLVERGVEVHLVSAHVCLHQLDIRVHYHQLSILAPWGYLASVPELKKLLKDIKPDLMNAHYASGYGLLARLTNFKPLLLSVWGSDVYDFPSKSSLHHRLLRGNLKAATALASTSHCMARRTKNILDDREIFITPFGVDESIFYPPERESLCEAEKEIVIGTVKSLKDKYGIDTLIEAFAITHKKLGHKYSIRLEIVGGGDIMPKLKGLASELAVAHLVKFHGFIQHQDIPNVLRRFDIYAALSRLDSESFGVAILEAGACEKPVVVSNADGLAEVVVDGVTGFVVPKNSPEDAARAIINLVEDAELRKKISLAARSHVISNYTWSFSLDLMLKAYEKTIQIDQP